MSFLQELQRRKVVRTTVAYLAGAFVTAQAVQLLVDGLELPSWILKAVLIALVVALPLVVGLAWAFDLTQAGVEKTGADPAQSRLAVPWRRVALPITASVLLLIAALAFVSLNKPARAELNQNLIAVMPFHVAGDPQLAYLRDGMVDLLAAKLTGEGGPRAADPRAVLSAVRRASEGGDVAEKIATEIGVDLGAGKVLVGSIVGTPQQLEISARVISATDGHVLAQETQSGSADSLLTTVDRLVAKLLSVQAGEGPQRLALLTTTSLPALRAYLDAQAAYRSGHFGRAIALFNRALDEDSTFALAALGLRLSGSWGEGPPYDHARVQRVLSAQRQRLGAVDQLLANAVLRAGQGRTIAQRLADFEAVVKAAPDRADAWFQYGDLMTHWGLLASHPDAVELSDVAFSRVLQLDSTFLPAIVHRMDNVFWLGNLEEFRRLEAIRKRLDPEGNAALYQLSWRSHILGDSTALRAERTALDTMSQERLALIRYVGGTAPGAVSDAVRAIEQRIRKSATNAEREVALFDAAASYMSYGMPARAAVAADELLRITKDKLYVRIFQVMSAVYEHGDTAGAARAAGDLEADLRGSLGMADRVVAHCALEQWRAGRGDLRSIDAAIESMAGIPQDSLDARRNAEVCRAALLALKEMESGTGAAQRAAAHGLNERMRDGPAVDFMLRNAANIVLGRVAERSGDRKLAYSAYSRIPFHPAGWAFLSTMHREAARLAALNGERERAVLTYTFYLNMQEMAEPAVRAEVEAARKHLAELVQERR